MPFVKRDELKRMRQRLAFLEAEYANLLKVNNNIIRYIINKPASAKERGAKIDELVRQVSESQRHGSGLDL